MKLRVYNITIASLLGASFVEHIIHQRCWYSFYEMCKKTSCLSDRKVRRKNQIPEYSTPSLKGYDEEDTKSINKKLPNLVGVLRKKTKRSMKYDW